MKPATWTTVAIVLAAGITTAAQDPVKVDPAHYKLLLENPSVRVLQITYPAGATSKMHQHPDAIIVSLSDGKMQFTMPDGTKQDSTLTGKQAVYEAAGPHNPTNVGKTTFSAILVEFKTPKPGTATIPTERPDMKLKSLAEGPRATAYLVTAEPGFHEPANTKHDFDQVIIPLAPMQMSLTIDGRPAKTSWKRGEAAFIGRGQAHESKNTGAKPVDLVIVAIK
jgi:quercetin dioxygenase-like cupin family protein